MNRMPHSMQVVSHVAWLMVVEEAESPRIMLEAEVVELRFCSADSLADGIPLAVGVAGAEPGRRAELAWMDVRGPAVAEVVLVACSWQASSLCGCCSPSCRLGSGCRLPAKPKGKGPLQGHILRTPA